MTTQAQKDALIASAAAVVALADALTADAPPPPPPPPPPPVSEVRYRYQHKRLFQPKGVCPQDCGPTSRYVDAVVAWPWDRAGGDVVGPDGVRQSPVPWFSAPANAVSGSTAVANYQVDVTFLLNAVVLEKRWCALLLNVANSKVYRTIAGKFQEQYLKPVITGHYADTGEAFTLPCWLIASVVPGSAPEQDVPNSMAPACNLPAMVEFDRPLRAVSDASFAYTLTAHWAGSTSVQGFLLDPPINKEPVQQGIAASAGPLDEGIASIGAHRYLDGTVFEDFVSRGLNTWAYNMGAEMNYDPFIWDESKPHDTEKFPHKHAGKWIGVGNNWSLIPSTHIEEGFAPLAPGLGAMRITMPDEGIPEGSQIGYVGTNAATSSIFLSEQLFGRLKRIFVRYYVRLAPYVSVGRRLRYMRGSQPIMTSMGGKTGLGPAHPTTWGGVSETSGGGWGWLLRDAWGDLDAGVDGPDEGGIVTGLHMVDFQRNNAINYAGDFPRDKMYGQKGGLGGVWYFDKWYCIEKEIDLNTVMPEAPGYLEDGAARVWMDGRLTFERSGHSGVFRKLPRSWPGYPNPTDPSTTIRPCREVGHREAVHLNWFHGGLTPSTIARTMFITGVVWSHDYIGPMKGI